MNIKNRLKKLESEVIDDSAFCGCEKELQIIVLIPTPDGKGKMIDGEPYIEPPEFCATCGKKTPETIHTTFVIQPREDFNGVAG